MNKVTVRQSNEVEVKTFVLENFIQDEVHYATMKKVTKNEIRDMAKKLDLAYNDEQIFFTKKVINAYLKKLGKRE